jgi:hypothetical protein
MEKPRSTALPVILGVLALLVLYVASYLALVVPVAFLRIPANNSPAETMLLITNPMDHYRWGGMRAAWLFYPLEQIDRRMRPGSWKE